MEILIGFAVVVLLVVGVPGIQIASARQRSWVWGQCTTTHRLYGVILNYETLIGYKRRRKNR